MEYPMEVVGYGCRLFDDEAAATYIAAEEHLLGWEHDASIKIDRFDVLSFLDDKRFFANDGVSYEPSKEEQAYEEERYADLERDEADPPANNAHSTAAAGIPFDYDVLHNRSSPAPPSAVPDDAMDVPLPDQIQLLLQICHTASYLTGKEGYVLSQLTGKHGTNPLCSFLLSSSPYHALFQYCLQWYRQHPEAATDDLVQTLRRTVTDVRAEAAWQLSKAKIDRFIELAITKDEDFLLKVQQREAANPDFDFLQPDHDHYEYFYDRYLEKRGFEASAEETAPDSNKRPKSG